MVQREQPRPAFLEPSSKPVQGDLADRHESLLVALADHPDEPPSVERSSRSSPSASLTRSPAA